MDEAVIEGNGPKSDFATPETKPVTVEIKSKKAQGKVSRYPEK